MGLYQWSWIDKPPGDGDGAGEAGGGGEVDVVRHKKPRGAPKRFHTWCEVAGAWVKDSSTTTATAAVEGPKYFSGSPISLSGSRPQKIEYLL